MLINNGHIELDHDWKPPSTLFECSLACGGSLILILYVIYEKNQYLSTMGKRDLGGGNRFAPSPSNTPLRRFFLFVLWVATRIHRWSSWAYSIACVIQITANELRNIVILPYPIKLLLWNSKRVVPCIRDSIKIKRKPAVFCETVVFPITDNHNIIRFE